MEDTCEVQTNGLKMVVISSNRKLQYDTISVKIVIGAEIPNSRIGDWPNECTTAYLGEGELYIIKYFNSMLCKNLTVKS